MIKNKNVNHQQFLVMIKRAGQNRFHHPAQLIFTQQFSLYALLPLTFCVGFYFARNRTIALFPSSE